MRPDPGSSFPDGEQLKPLPKMTTLLKSAVIELPLTTSLRILQSGAPLEYLRHHCYSVHHIKPESVTPDDLAALKLNTDAALIDLTPLIEEIGLKQAV